jgi:hypothetical protein
VRQASSVKYQSRKAHFTELSFSYVNSSTEFEYKFEHKFEYNSSDGFIVELQMFIMKKRIQLWHTNLIDWYMPDLWLNIHKDKYIFHFTDFHTSQNY